MEGFDPIWFGVITAIMLEMGLITPPVGINVFIIAGMARDAPMYNICKGVWPFVIAMAVCIILLIAFPQIALFLPNAIKYAGGEPRTLLDTARNSMVTSVRPATK